MSDEAPLLARKLGLFDAAMLVIGGIVGAGIFMNPAVVAKEVHTAGMILAAWAFGGAVALAGAFVYAELAYDRPALGGQYAYLKEAMHPMVAFLYGWGLLLVVQTGGMAAVAMTFAHYFVSMTHISVGEGPVAIGALALLTIINCLGVKAGSNVQNLLTVLKMGAIGFLIIAGFAGLNRTGIELTPFIDRPGTVSAVGAFGAALIPVLFAYGGWQTACFVGTELKQPERNLPLGLLFGVLGVAALYLGVNLVCLYALGPDQLAASKAPATEVMRMALGEKGAMIIALGITISTLGFLSQGMLTAPRVYFAMASDGLFFKKVAQVNPRTQVPVFAVALQGVLACIIALSGSYGRILNYVVSVDFIFYGLTAACLFIYRSRFPSRTQVAMFRVPGHPLTTLFFMLSCWVVVVATVWKYPGDSLIGLGILAAGVPVYLYWNARRQTEDANGDQETP